MTVAQLHPEGQATIDLIAAGDPISEDYIIDLGSLDLRESERLEVAYSEGASTDGGEAIAFHGPLVTISFDLIVQGSGVDEDAARQQMLERVQTIEAAVCNVEGGTFEYKPTGLGAGVRSTYYAYEQGQPPRVRAKTENNWDASPVETAPSYVCTIELEVELQTQPFATSDPDTPVSVLAQTTVYNQDDSVVGYVTIQDSNLPGTIPALVQLRIRNLVSGTWAAIEKLWYARRTKGTLGNFAPILEGGTPDTDSSVHWSTESDTTRRSDNYQRYAPPEAANNLWATSEYTISNITDHEGKAAIIVVCRSLAETREAWDLKATLEVANVVVETGVKNVATVGAWTVCILGELDIPPTPISADESYATKLYLYLRRTTGDEIQAIDIDFVQLLFVDEYVQQVNITDGYTNSYRLLLENFKQELCHIVNQATLAFEKVAEPLCELLKLEPGIDNRIDFIWERLRREVLVEDFEDYESWRWMKIADCEDDENWVAQYSGDGSSVSAETTYYVEADQGIRCTRATSGAGDGYAWASLAFDATQDFTVEGRFTDADFVYLTYYLSHTVAAGSLRFHTGPGFNSNYYLAALPSFTAGIHYEKIKKSSFGESGAPSWSTIIGTSIITFFTDSGAYISFDDIRLARADPDDATKGNDTRDVWDFEADVWHVYELDSATKTLGCIDNAAGVEQVALIHDEPPANIKYLAKVLAKRDDGDVGLIFRCEDGTSGSEDMAAFFIDTTNDELELRKWAAGSASDIASAVSQATAPDTDYWLGVWIIDNNRVRCYFGTSEAAIWDDENEEFVTSARVFNETDSVFATGGALAGGQCGLLSIGTLGRFDDVELRGAAGHVPGDTIQVEAKAVLRTIYPFRE